MQFGKWKDFSSFLSTDTASYCARVIGYIFSFSKQLKCLFIALITLCTIPVSFSVGKIGTFGKADGVSLYGVFIHESNWVVKFATRCWSVSMYLVIDWHFVYSALALGPSFSGTEMTLTRIKYYNNKPNKLTRLSVSYFSFWSACRLSG